MYALFDYVAVKKDELSFCENDKIQVSNTALNNNPFITLLTVYNALYNKQQYYIISNM